MIALLGLPIPLTSYREPGVLRRLSTTPVPPNYTPLGAAVEAIQDSTLGGFPPLAPLLVLAAYAVVFGFLARRCFLWE